MGGVVSMVTRPEGKVTFYPTKQCSSDHFFADHFQKVTEAAHQRNTALRVNNANEGCGLCDWG